MVAETIDNKFEPLSIWIEGTVVPYTRMTRRGKYVKPDAIKYLDSQNRLKTLLSEANHNREYYGMWHVPEKVEFMAEMSFNVASLHHCDLDNLIKAVMDACQGVLFKDDRYCDVISAKRVKCKPGDEGVNIRILEAEDDIPY